MDGTGALAKSLAGRDKEEIFVIIEEAGEYIFLADGKCRLLEKPKRKNKKHIQIIHDREEQRRRSLIQEEKLTDVQIRKSIQCYKRESQI